MDSESSPRSGEVSARIQQMAVLAIATLAGSILVGRLLGLWPIQNWHEASFESIVEGLQRVPLLLDVSTVLTDAGHTSINFAMLLVLAVYALVAKRAEGVSWLLVLAAIAVLLRPFQSVVTVLVDGTTPESPLIQGTAGPYFSGGVLRVLVIFGTAAALLGLQKRTVVVIAVVAGSIEGLTRLVLGRHWPLDIVAALPIGLAVLTLVILSEELLSDRISSFRTARI